MKAAFGTIIIGAGPGGYPLAAALAAAGENVAVIERSHPGGTCLNRGCIPTKCLAASAERALECAGAADFGIHTGPVSVDYPAVAARMNAVVAELRSQVLAVLGRCTVIEGEARLLPGMEVAVGEDVYAAPRRIVIATGSQPARLPVEGADLALTSDDVLALEQLPQSAVIIGGGVIGMEFASIMAALGSEVSVIEYCKEILPPFDPEIAKRLRQKLTRRGIDIMTGAGVTRLERNADGGGVTVHFADKRGERQMQADCAVMAVGRRPVVPAGVAEAGVNLTDRGFIAVDSLMRTSAPGIYAIGDVNGLCQLAHAASAQANVVLTGEADIFNAAATPAVVFTVPEVAAVGPLTFADRAVDVIRRNYASNGKALAMGADGVLKLTVDRETRALLAATAIGPHAADLIAEATILIKEGTPLEQIPRRYTHVHPTLSELFV